MQVSLLGRVGRALAAKAMEAPKTGKIGYSPDDLVPRLAGLIPKVPGCEQIKAAEMPWVKRSERFFETWEKVAPAMPKYQVFLSSHKTGGTFGGNVQFDMKAMGRQQEGKVMKEQSQVALAEFYLDVAYRLRPESIDQAGSDSQSLLQVARTCAEEDFEPWLEDARHFVADYDPKLHKQLEDTSPFYEVSNDLFWWANFDLAAPAAFQHYLTALGHGSGQAFTPTAGHVPPEQVDKIVSSVADGLQRDEASYEPARRAAEVVYSKWLETSAMPVQGTIVDLLMTHGLLVSDAEMPEERLLPEKAAEMRA